MRSIGFHASKGVIRFVVVDNKGDKPLVIAHEKRPLQLLSDRPEFIHNARNLFGNVLANWPADRLAYILTMSAKSQDQLAGLLLPFGVLNACAREAERPCLEFIAPNFSKTFFAKRGAAWTGDRYTSTDALLGTHPPNWTDSERLAALAAWGAM